MTDLCKCGHGMDTHRPDADGRRGRGGCTGERRVFLRRPDPAFKRACDDILDQERVGKLAEVVRRNPEGKDGQKLLKAFKRGYMLLECNCPTFHLVELGKVNIIKPTGLIT